MWELFAPLHVARFLHLRAGATEQTWLPPVGWSTSKRKEAGQPLATMYEEIPMQGIETAPGAPDSAVALGRSLHRLNILLTYRWLDGAATPTAA